ncbi:MAG: recombinase family protein [Chloroflexi bacterium]|nr:recombinase family protein [Chloroflexota bacterium]
MTTSTATKRAVGYLRVSSPGQTGERHSSLETQEARFQEFCQRNDSTPVAVFTDVVSGRRDDRVEYRRMLEYVMDGGADTVVVQLLDRFGRNPGEILQRYWQLQDSGVSVVATDEDIKDELLLLIKAGIAGAESRRTSERVKANMSRAVQKGVHAARAPFGLKRVYQGRETKWEIDPLEAPVLREMYRLAVEENLGYKRIGDTLTQMGYRARGGRPFASFTVQRILSNEALVGTLAYGKHPRKGNPQPEIVRVKDFFPAILSEDEWQRLQDRQTIRRETGRGRTHSSFYLLSGIARCGHCGGPMTGKAGAPYKGKQYLNYRCSRSTKSRELCSFYNSHSAPKLERAVLEYLGQFSDPELVQAHLAAAEAQEIKTKESELEEVERALKDLEAQFTKHLDYLKRDILNEKEFVKANEACRSQVEGLQIRQDELDRWVEKQSGITSAAERLPGEIKTFLEDFQGMDVRRQKSHLQTLLKAAYVYGHDTIELEFRK